MAYTTINKHTEHFNTKLYTGNGSAIGSGGNAITGVGFQPDLTWIKSRSASNRNHYMYDVVRGVEKRLMVNNNNAEATLDESLEVFGSDGFTVGSHAHHNYSSETYASWNWKAGNSAGSTNNDGSTTSTVSVNTTAKFSIVKYSGSSSTATIGHGLGVVPKMIWVKNLTSGYEWAIYHYAMGNTKYMNFDTTSSELDDTVWNDTTPTNQVFTCGGQKIYTNYSGQDYIAYCFADVPGFCSIGEYRGNESTNNAFVYTGMKPSFILIKNFHGTNNWMLFDNKRAGYNVDNNAQHPNENVVDQTDDELDILSNGFKIRLSNQETGHNGHRYLYIAFGQSLVGSNNVCATAR